MNFRLKALPLVVIPYVPKQVSLSFSHSAVRRELTRVVGTLNSAVLGAGGSVRASSHVPCVSGEAVGVSADSVGPAPVGVERNGAGLACAAGSAGTSAGRPSQLGVSLSGRRASLLSAGGSVERKRCKSERPVHDCCRKESRSWILEVFSNVGRTTYIQAPGLSATLMCSTLTMYPYDYRV
jgi:hypothetical protein